MKQLTVADTCGDDWKFLQYNSDVFHYNHLTGEDYAYYFMKMDDKGIPIQLYGSYSAKYAANIYLTEHKL